MRTLHVVDPLMVASVQTLLEGVVKVLVADTVQEAAGALNVIELHNLDELRDAYAYCCRAVGLSPATEDLTSMGILELIPQEALAIILGHPDQPYHFVFRRLVRTREADNKAMQVRTGT